jgi:heme exporter protein D
MAMSILSALPWFAWIAIVAIVTSMITGVIQALIQHRERMAMIEHGIHQDAPQGTDEVPLAGLAKARFPEL